MGLPGTYDSLQAFYPSVRFESGLYEMWYTGCPLSYACTIAYATSSDGRNWTKSGPVMDPAGGSEAIVGYPSVVKVSGTYWMYYAGSDGTYFRVFAATSPDGVTWTRRGQVLDVGTTGSNDSTQVTFPDVLYLDRTFVMWYTGRPGNTAIGGTIMRAVSTDGLNWTKEGSVLEPGAVGTADQLEVEYSSVAVVDGTYIMIYSGRANASAPSVLLYADSADGIHWRRIGTLLGSLPGTETNLYQPDALVLPNGTWDVFYAVRNGAGDLEIYLATGTYSVPQQGTEASIFGLPLLEFAMLLSLVGIGAGFLVFVLVVLSKGRRSRFPPPGSPPLGPRP